MSMLSPAGAQRQSQSVGQMAQAIERMVARNGVRWRRLTILEGLGLAIAAPLGFLWLAFLIDNGLHLPMWGRVLALGLFVGMTAWLAWRLIARWKRLRLTEDQVALAIEQRSGGKVQNRLINAVQIARQGGAGAQGKAYEQALIQENYHRLHEMELQQAAQARPAILRLGLAAVAIVIGAGFWFLKPDYFSNAAQRILLPLGHIEPIYRTRLKLDTGSVNDRGEFPFTITIEGKQPDELLLIQNRQGQRSTVRIPVSAQQSTVRYTLTDVRSSMTFAVAGNDYTTAYHQIVVPRPATLTQVRATLQYPSYTQQADKQVVSADGRLEALSGTLGRVTFVLDQPASQVKLKLLRPDGDASAGEHVVSLKPTREGNAFTGDILFKGVVGYELLTRRQEDDGFQPGRTYSLLETLDQEPWLELRGLADASEVDFDMPAGLDVIANDDYGLRNVELAYRQARQAGASDAESSSSPAESSGGGWQVVQHWPGQNKAALAVAHELKVESLGVAEGDQLELLVRGQDNDPTRMDHWTTGSAIRVTVGGKGVTLQLVYQGMLRDEARLRELLAASQTLRGQAIGWQQKLDPASGFDPKSSAGARQWSQGMAKLIKAQSALRASAGALARDMNPQAGNLRLSVGMLADTEMIRLARILERAADPASEQVATTLANARLTQDRILKSLEEILTGHVKYRQEWEDANMGAFIHMMAGRQVSLHERSQKLAGESGQAAGVKRTAERRQRKLEELATLSGQASGDVAQRLGESQPILAKAFGEASRRLADAPLKQAMAQAAKLSASGDWTGAMRHQSQAADMLQAIDKLIDDARKEAAKQVVAQLEATQLQESATADQGQVDELRKNPGAVQIDAPENMSIKQIIQMREKVQQQKGEMATVGKLNEHLFADSQIHKLNRPNQDRVDSDTLKLATKATESNLRNPNQSDRQGNEVPPNLSEDFEDVVGDLLEGLETLRDQYDTLNLNANFSITDPGEIGQQAGDINSNSASAATGNKQPPPTQIGGMSRSGRKGARSHGTAVGDESFNRRGRNEAQEGMEKVKDVAGLMREVDTDDPQKDQSTGVGGKVIDTKESHFSIKDKGKWTDDIADRMRKPLEKNQIVERQDGTKMDPKVAAMLYELEGSQEQIIERLKVIRKKLDNLYLPTDQIDELMARLNANLDALRERPDAELFRTQLETIEQLRGSIRVFGQAHSGFEPSLPRKQAVQGRVLDNPARQPLPGYEEAVRNYYLMLSTE